MKICDVFSQAQILSKQIDVIGVHFHSTNGFYNLT